MPRRPAALLSLLLAGSALVPAVAHAHDDCRCERRKIIRVCGYPANGTPVIRPCTSVRGVRCRTVRTVTLQPVAPTACGPCAGASRAVVTVTARRPRVTTFAVYRQVGTTDLDLRALDAETFDDLPEAPG